MATHSSILACRIPWAIYSPWGRRVGHIECLSQAEKGPKCRKVTSGLYLRVLHIQVQVKPSEKLYSPR